MNKQQLQQLDKNSLMNEIFQMKKELFNLKLNRASGQVKDLSQIRKIRSLIACAKTYLTQLSKNA